MKRIFGVLLFFLPFLILLPFFFLNFPHITRYYYYTIFIITLLSTLVSIYFMYSSDDQETKRFFILLSFSMFFYSLNGFFDAFDFYSQYSSSQSFFQYYEIFAEFIGNFPILILLIDRTIRDLKFLKQDSRRVFFIGSFVAASGFILIGVIAVTTASFLSIPRIDIFLYLPFLIEDIAIMVLLVTLFILYIGLNFRYYIFALLAGYIFAFVGDVYQLLSGLFDDVRLRNISRALTLLAFTLLLAILIWIRARTFTISSLKTIDEERQKYKALYAELDDKVRDLLILTQLLRHDLGNDITVISNALGIYQEEPSKRLMELAINRLEQMEQRISKLRSTSEIYASLKIQAMPIIFIEDIVKLFDNTSLKIVNKNLLIKANQLIHFIMFNIIQNVFKHAGDNVKASILVEEINHDLVSIKVIDDGIGIPNEQKNAILKGIPKIDEIDKLAQGVGLSLAKQTIEGLGGRLKIEDNNPHGTIVIIEIPKFITANTTP